MSLKAFKHQGKEVWDNWTYGLKHPSDYRDRQQLRKAVKEMKKLSHRQERLEGKVLSRDILKGM